LRCPVIPESQDLGREYRHLVSGHYRTLFKIAGEKVIIMRVIHGARLLDMEMLK
jgi:plasmid stabilization system protein ParE